uniref:Uncharacterized protein n=1 Tax=Rhizophora mucronata TaxID=61149 RepID=A0A2P2NKH8_RHIMU
MPCLWYIYERKAKSIDDAKIKKTHSL